MTRDLHCSMLLANVGLTLYAVGFGIVPLVTAPLSEEFGRRPLYLISGVGFTLMHVMEAL